MFRKIAVILLKIYFKIFNNLEYVGLENLPKEGPYILYGNHRSNCDPLVMQLNINQTVRFMGKKELFDNKIASKFFYKMGVFPVDREKAMKATLQAIKILKNGEILGIFPEGTRNKEDKNIDDVDVKSGLAVIGVKTKAMMVPTIIQGNGKPFTKLKVIYEKPKDLSSYNSKGLSKDDYLRISRELMEEIYKKI